MAANRKMKHRAKSGIPCLLTPYLLFLSLLVLANYSYAQQATIEGNVIHIPVVLVGELGYTIDLQIVSNSNPPVLQD